MVYKIKTQAANIFIGDSFLHPTMSNLTPLCCCTRPTRSLPWPAVARWARCAPPLRTASRDCGLYYECAGTTPVLMQCPPASTGTGTVCNWPVPAAAPWTW